MSRVQTENRIKALLVEHLGVEEAEVTPEALIVPDHDKEGRVIRASGKADLGADSLDIVELVMACEEEFGVEITDDEAERLNDGTVKDLVDLVDGKLEAEAS